jgi:hypothetical protein
MPATHKAKAKRSYHTDDLREERMQAAKRDVEQRQIPIRTASRLHKVRLGPNLNCIHYKLTSLKSLGSLRDVVGSPAWTCAQEEGERAPTDPFPTTRGDASRLD